MSSSRTARRTATVVAALTTALVLTLGPTVAHAAGWSTLITRTHSASVGAKGWHYTNMQFRFKANVMYRMCVRVKGNATFYWPAGVTKHTINTSSWTSKCYTYTPSSDGVYDPHLYVHTGKLQINRSTVERYYTGAIPV